MMARISVSHAPDATEMRDAPLSTATLSVEAVSLVAPPALYDDARAVSG
jgi:hypothetical protein